MKVKLEKGGEEARKNKKNVEIMTIFYLVVFAKMVLWFKMIRIKKYQI